ncbi:uroporphyrinogen-III synthase [Janthinobacterium agaricidamnosum]|uniref:Uroporphyrinogen-III synthase n=1 Tax=Janthinobacterium agaricidamnosum NBRC 102515 = DSM 9628 TaxID=1349767 RepID=W0V482_9BURK|nr:uroporphyrinogen-III synthase [Janthinobacterium agaricidamnosum]CDG82067.1 uroporphyrinogen-III synthase HemD family protein [Janthinobacterium agaricidamnosum NBRC 102515 = DSM 9628]
MADTVVITRPLAQAGPLAERVAALGRPVCILPLLEIEALDDQAGLKTALAGLAGYDLVAFVSPNAIDAAFAHIRSWPAGLKLAVLGEGSRLALAAHGVTPDNTDIISPFDAAHSDSEHLLMTLDLDSLRGSKVLIVRGESGRELMADGLRQAGAAVTFIAAYRRRVPPLTPALQATLLGLLQRENDWIITSSEALRGLRGLLQEIDASAAGRPRNGAPQETAVAKMQQQHLIIPHARIAQTAKELGFTRLTLTGSGDERVLAALQSRP